MSLGERAHIRHEAPDVLVGNSAAPRRHAVGSALIDRLEDFAIGPPEMPTAVLETRPHGAGPVGAMTIETVVRDEQLAALGHALAVAVEGVDELDVRTLGRGTRLNVV